MAQPKSKFLKYIVIGTVVAGLLVLAKQFDLQTVFHNALLWVDSLGAWGPIAFIIIYNLATILFLPGSLLTLGGGVLFGVVKGSLYVFMAALVGATLAFLIGRYVARGWVSGKIAGNQKFRVIDEAIAKEGFKIVLLTRLSPIFPFNLLNYALGLTQVSLKDYVLGSLGMLPGTIMYVYIGSLAGSLATIGMETIDPQTARIQWIIRIVGFIATVAVTLYVTKVAKKALDNSVENATL